MTEAITLAIAIMVGVASGNIVATKTRTIIDGVIVLLAMFAMMFVGVTMGWQL